MRERMLSGKVVVEVVDRRTGRVKKRVVSNTIAIEWADFITGAIANGFSGTMGKYDGIELLSGSTTIKTLSASSSKSCTESGCQVVFTATDSSTDEYSADTILLTSSNPQDAPKYIAYSYVSIKKGKSDIVRITWTVSQPAGTPYWLHQLKP